MFTFEGTIKDAYGLTHTNPVFVVKNFNSQNARNLSGHYNTQTHEQSDYVNDNRYVSYNISYWTNQEAKDEGAEALVFIDNQFNQSFNINPQVDLSSADEVLEVVENDFRDNVLPQFTVEGDEE